ncbi:hypothetical protein SAMN04515671_3180 [Nakamurella panacisegetis]|uniref:Transmembrane protein n=1 Tax=Nakamurella panacisegetis TaxID=1090615 RepID=A0A1H0QNV9_9ACTN|nr:hypothetical protein [Nakamurella panacisegetis]SDP18870.1 hypothetical protein SAMN04515671_3180 [Nakamurella panacisegetis]
MPNSGPFGIDPEDIDRVLRSAAEQLRGVFGGLGEGTGRPGWPGPFTESARRARPTPEPETTGETGDGVWVIYTVGDDGGAQVEQVFAAELDALRANKNNTDPRRMVRFLPYGIPVTVLDAPEEPGKEK